MKKNELKIVFVSFLITKVNHFTTVKICLSMLPVPTVCKSNPQRLSKSDNFLRYRLEVFHLLHPPPPSSSLQLFGLIFLHKITGNSDGASGFKGTVSWDSNNFIGTFCIFAEKYFAAFALVWKSYTKILLVNMLYFLLQKNPSSNSRQFRLLKHLQKAAYNTEKNSLKIHILWLCPIKHVKTCSLSLVSSERILSHVLPFCFSWDNDLT